MTPWLAVLGLGLLAVLGLGLLRRDLARGAEQLRVAVARECALLHADGLRAASQLRTDLHDVAATVRSLPAPVAPSEGTERMSKQLAAVRAEAVRLEQSNEKLRSELGVAQRGGPARIAAFDHELAVGEAQGVPPEVLRALRLTRDVSLLDPEEES